MQGRGCVMSKKLWPIVSFKGWHMNKYLEGCDVFKRWVCLGQRKKKKEAYMGHDIRQVFGAISLNGPIGHYKYYDKLRRKKILPETVTEKSVSSSNVQQIQVQPMLGLRKGDSNWTARNDISLKSMCL